MVKSHRWPHLSPLRTFTMPSPIATGFRARISYQAYCNAHRVAKTARQSIPDACTTKLHV